MKLYKRRLPSRVKKRLRKHYLKLTQDARDDFLWEIRTTHNYFQQIYCGHKTASGDLAARIVNASNGAITLDDII
jgi:hypothetical protein